MVHEKKIFKFSYSFLNSCEQTPRPRWLLPHLQSNVIKQNEAQKRFRRRTPGSAETCRPCEHSIETVQRELTKRSDSLINILQTGQSKVLSPRLLTSKFCSIFAAYSRHHVHFMHYSILEIHALYLFLPLKELKKPNYPAKRRLHTLYWYIKARVMIIWNWWSCRTRSYTSYLGDIIFTPHETWHGVTIPFSTENRQVQLYSSTQFCCFWTYARYIRFVLKYCICETMRKRVTSYKRLARYRHGQIEISRNLNIPSHLRIKASQEGAGRDEGEHLSMMKFWCTSKKVNCNNHIINLIVAAMPPIPQDRATHVQRKQTESKFVSMEHIHKMTLKPKSHDSSFKKKNVYQCKNV